MPGSVSVPRQLANLVGAQAVDVGQAVPNQVHGVLVQLLEVVGREVQAGPLESQPPHVLLDRLDVLDVFLRRVRVVEPQVARSAELLRDAEVQADRFGVADVQVAVRLGREPCGHARNPARLQIVRHDRADEVLRRDAAPRRAGDLRGGISHGNGAFDYTQPARDARNGTRASRAIPATYCTY